MKVNSSKCLYKEVCDCVGVCENCQHKYDTVLNIEFYNKLREEYNKPKEEIDEGLKADIVASKRLR